MKVRKRRIIAVKKGTARAMRYLALYKERGQYKDFEDKGDFGYLYDGLNSLASTLPKAIDETEIINGEEYYNVDVSTINGWLQTVARLCLYLDGKLQDHPLLFIQNGGTWRFIVGDMIADIYDKLLSFCVGAENMESVRLRDALIDRHWFG